MNVMEKDYTLNICECGKTPKGGLGDNRMYRAICPKFEGGCGKSTYQKVTMKQAEDNWNNKIFAN